MLSFETDKDRTGHIGYFLPKVEIREYNVLIDDQNFFDQPVKNELRTYENVGKITTCQGEDYRSVFLLVYPYLKKKL